ncbi:hypothetical protein [Moraxella lacunata]|uniref:hypothetical protein n=1 Tax=Moraxella lacunata TaxID=477 RepID=UPI003EDF94C0
MHHKRHPNKCCHIHSYEKWSNHCSVLKNLMILSYLFVWIYFHWCKHSKLALSKKNYI